MTKEKEVKPDTQKQDEEVEETSSEEETTESNEDESSSKTEDVEVDYKALLNAEKERAEKAERALAADRYKASKSKREEIVEEEISSDDEDKPLTKKDLQALLLKERQATQKSFEETHALEIARKNTVSEDEAQAALLYWRSRVIPTGNLEDDIMFAVGGLNHRKVIARNSELVRALKSKDGINRDTTTTHRDAVSGGVSKLSSGDTAAYKRAGFEYDNASKLWKKKMPNGKFLIKDPKTKQSYVQK